MDVDTHVIETFRLDRTTDKSGTTLPRAGS